MSMYEGDPIHPDDDVLVRLMDRELTAGERAAVRAHVEGCCGCAERLEELTMASGWWADQVSAADREIAVDELARARALAAARAAFAAKSAAAHSPRPAYLRVAAAVALLVLGGLAARPVSAWVGSMVGRSAGELVEAPGHEVVDLLAFFGATVSFMPGEGEFRIELAAQPAGGSLILAEAPDDRASAQASGAEGGAILVLPGGLQVENTSASTADYRVLLPPGRVNRVVVTAGGELLADVPLSAGGAARTIDLAGTSSP